MKKIEITSVDRQDKKHSIRFNFKSNIISSIYIGREAFDDGTPSRIKITIEAAE
jgi:hypothetical protein